MADASSLDMPRGLLIAALLAWTLTLMTDAGGALALIVAAPLFGQPIDAPFNQLAGMWWAYLVVGLPVAITVCIAFGWPLWTVLDWRGVRGTRNAVRVGAGFGCDTGIFQALCNFLFTGFHHIQHGLIHPGVQRQQDDDERKDLNNQHPQVNTKSFHVLLLSYTTLNSMRNAMTRP